MYVGNLQPMNNQYQCVSTLAAPWEFLRFPEVVESIVIQYNSSLNGDDVVSP